MRVLVVEDDPDLLRLLAGALKDAGYVVDTAKDGVEGHHLGDTEPYDVVVTSVGPSVRAVVRQKERVGPVWVNLNQRKFFDVPSVIAVLGSRPLPEMTTIEYRRRFRLGIEALVEDTATDSPDATFRDSSRVSGNGVVDRDARLLDASRAAPGYSPGELTFRSVAMLGGVLEIELGGPTPVTEHDRITVVNHATLGGTLELSLLNGYAPPLGSAFTILAAGSVSGQFARVIQPPGLAQGLRLRPQVSGSTVVLHVVQEADFNADGFLDFFDFLDFVACFEGDPCPPGADADFNADGFVDFFDYLDFVAAFEGG